MVEVRLRLLPAPERQSSMVNVNSAVVTMCPRECVRDHPPILRGKPPMSHVVHAHAGTATTRSFRGCVTAL